VTGGGFRTELRLSGRDVDLGEETLSASAGWHADPRFGVEAGVGVILDGRLTVDGEAHDVRPGIAATLTGSWLALPERVTRPFVLLALTASVATTETARADETARLTALDLRASVIAGKTFFSRLTPYLAGRVFGGPVFWRVAGEGVTGSDRHHFAVGAGVTLRLPGRLDLFAEAMPLGERSLNLGAGLSF